MKISSTVLLMLTIAPLAAVSALVFYEPSRWGGTPSLVSILVMTIFGYLTVTLWPTVFLALILTPLLMRYLAGFQRFSRIPLPLFILCALLGGALGGSIVLSPAIYMALSDSPSLAANWIFAGAVSGALTGVPVAIIHRDSSDLQHHASIANYHKV
jgi:hypothetical protein